MPQITVGCKLPHGLHLDVGAKRVTLNGSNSSLVIGGHGITENVDKDFFEQWLAQNKDSAAVKGGFIFANEKTNNVKAEASEKKDNKNGFEAINPKKPAKDIAPVEDK